MKKQCKKLIRTVLLILHLIVGIGALAGGSAAITNPVQPLGLSAEIYLKNSPFNDFLIPGIILFTVIGLGNLLAAVFIKLDVKFKGYISGFFACALIIWIVVQCIMLREINFLHVLFFSIGVVQGILASILLYKEMLFPFDIILNHFKI